MQTSNRRPWFLIGIPALIFIVILLVSLAAVGLLVLARLGFIPVELP